MKIPKIKNDDFDGIFLDSNGYGEQVNHIEIPHGRMMAIGEILTENEQAISRSELWKLLWIARIARPGAIYDASASAQPFPNRRNDGFFGRSRKYAF